MTENTERKMSVFKTVDNMGRILIAKSIRKKLDMITGTELMLGEENGQLIIEKKGNEGLYFATLDSVHRIVIPSELRKNLGMDMGTELEFFVEGERIVVKVKNLKCIFCEGTEKLYYYFNKPVCKKCILDIKKLAE